MTVLIIILALMVGGCTPTVKKVAFHKPEREVVIIKKGQFLFTEEERAFIRFEARRLGIQIPDKKEIRRELRYLLGNKKGMEIALKRASLYIPYIKPILGRYNLPDELAILPLIESRFNPFAVSRSGAGGIWQLMPATARRYGLRVDRYVDERFDLFRSTHAAAQYLRDLYRRFRNWELVLAAYNCGEGCVLRKTGGKDFWSRKARLPEQTRRFVPRFFAALLITRDPEKYGLNVRGMRLKLRRELVKEPSTVSDFVKKASVSESTFRDLNPHLRGDRIPADTYVYLPQIEVAKVVVIEKIDKRTEGSVSSGLTPLSVGKMDGKKRKRILLTGRKDVRKLQRKGKEDPFVRIGKVIRKSKRESVIVLENGAMVYIKE